MDTVEMRAKAQEIATRAQARNDEITAETTLEDANEIGREVDAMLDEARSLEARAERADQAAAMTARLEAREAEAEERARTAQRPVGTGSAAGHASQDAPSYRDAFVALWQAGGNAQDLDPELRAALRTGHRAMTEQRAQTTTGSAGGYMIPEAFSNELTIAMAAHGPMYDATWTREFVTETGATLDWPTINDTSQTGAASTEGAALTNDGGKDATIGEVVFNAYAYDTEFLKVSLELAQDSAFNIGSVLGELLGERLGRTINTALTTGTGSDQPRGIVTAAPAGVTAASASAITWDEIIDLEHSIDPAYRSAPRFGWMFNDATLAFLRKLKDGDGNYLWQAGNVQRGVPATFNGKPYRINQGMASIAADAKTIVCGDLSKYVVRKVRGFPLIGMVQDTTTFPGFAIAGYTRVDGDCIDTRAIKHLAQASS